MELLLKITSILSLLFYYLLKTEKKNTAYIIILLNSCFLSYFLITEKLETFGINHVIIGSWLMIVNRAIYTIIPLREIIKFSNKTTLLYLSIFAVPVFIVLNLVFSFLGKFSTTTIIIGILLGSMCCFSFIRFLKTNTKSNVHYFIGLLILAIADCLIVYNQFISYDIYVVVFYNILYFASRYFICNSFIEKSNI